MQNAKKPNHLTQYLNQLGQNMEYVARAGKVSGNLMHSETKAKLDLNQKADLKQNWI